MWVVEVVVVVVCVCVGGGGGQAQRGCQGPAARGGRALSGGSAPA
eukprot:COSAG04_NODE_17270_length_474_cov_0.816000_1_plen_44_part_10